MNLFILKLCWKNIWRNRRRTLITVNAIGVGVMALVWLHNYYDTFHEQIVNNAIRFHSGHVLVTHQENEVGKAPKKFIQNPASLFSWFKQRPAVKSFSPSVSTQGLLSTPKGSANIWFKGVYPEYEKKTTDFASRMVSGTFFGASKAENPIVIGAELAKQLNVNVGNKVVALTQGVDGSIGNELFRVVGVFKTDSNYDGTLVFVHISDARRLLSLPAGSIHQVALVLNTKSQIQAEIHAFEGRFSPEIVKALPWSEVQRNLMAVIEVNRSANQIVMWIILAVAGLGIMNSILMSLMERKREFGVMMAVGTFKKEMKNMVVLETLMLGVVGVFIGNVLGILVTLYFNRVGFDLSWLTSEPLVVNGTLIQTVSYPTVNWMNSVTITIAILAISVLVSWIPINHVSGLRPVQALRDL